MNKAALKTFDYAKEISSDITAVHISTDQSSTELLQKQWAELGIGVPLTVISAQFREVIAPLEQYISDRDANLVFGQKLTVILTKFVGGGWHNEIFHNQTTFFIERKLGGHKNVVTVLVPYVYK